jgi:hypothetical protein
MDPGATQMLVNRQDPTMSEYAVAPATRQRASCAAPGPAAAHRVRHLGKARASYLEKGGKIGVIVGS